MRRSLQLLLALTLTACGSPNDQDRKGLDGTLNNSQQDPQGSEEAQADGSSIPNAEDDQPIAGLDADELLALPYGEAPNKPCGLLRSGEKELLNRFGWDEDGRLQIFDYVFIGEDQWDLESRAVRIYDDQGRLTDEVYVEGTQGMIDRRNWYEWSGDQPVARYSNKEYQGNVAFTIGATEARGTESYTLSEDGLMLTVQRDHAPDTHLEYDLLSPVTLKEVVLADGIFETFSLLGPIDEAREVGRGFNDLTQEYEDFVEVTDYETDAQGRVTKMGDRELIYDCRPYDL